MKKNRTFNKFLTLLFVLSCFELPICAQMNLSELFQSSLPSIVKIVTYDAHNRPLATGTGFFISHEGKGISNLHVFRGAYKSQVTTSSGKTYIIKDIFYKNEELDLITFSVENNNQEEFPYLKLADKVPNIGDAVFAIGNPIGLDFTISNGIISSIREQEGFGQVFQTNTSISAGNSGSPLIDMNGLAIGVITFTYTEGQNLNFAISLVKRELSNGFKSLDITQLSKDKEPTSPDWIEDAYGIVRGFHAGMCENWRFNIDFKRNMAINPNFEWDVYTTGVGKPKSLESHVQGYYEGSIVGTTIMFATNRNMTYVISYGLDDSTHENTNHSLLIISRITNGEVEYIFNGMVERKKMNNSYNRYIEQAGNSRISVIIEDKWFVREIYLEDNYNQISANGVTFYINSYEFK